MAWILLVMRAMVMCTLRAGQWRGGLGRRSVEWIVPQTVLETVGREYGVRV